MEDHKIDIREFFGPIHEADVDEEVYFKQLWQYDNNKKKKEDVYFSFSFNCSRKKNIKNNLIKKKILLKSNKKMNLFISKIYV